MTHMESQPPPHPGTGPEPVRRADPLSTGANWWDLPPLAPHELDVPTSPPAAAPPVTFGDPYPPIVAAPTMPGYMQPAYEQPFFQPGAQPGATRFSALPPRVGSSEAQVAAAPKRSMDQNDLGQRSLLCGIGLLLAFAVSQVASGPFASIVLYALAVLGLWYGVRGFNAASRGLATNRGTSIAGIALATVVTILDIIQYFTDLSATLQDLPGQ